MELRHLNTFRAVAATLNFTRAASTLGYAQSSVTAQIQALEEDLGRSLFDRLGRGIRLTEAGRNLLGYAERILDLSEEARLAALEDKGASGSLTISAAETIITYYLPPVLKAFREKHPGVRLAFRPSPVFELRRRVLDGSLDVVFVLERTVGTAGLEMEPLAEEPIVVISAPEHPLANKPHVRAGELKGEPILFTELGCAYRNQFEKSLIDNGAYPSAALEFSSIEAIKKCVMAHMGISVLPRIAVRKELESGALAALDWAEDPIRVRTQMLWHKKSTDSPLIQAFLDIVRGRFGKEQQTAAKARGG